MSKVLLYYGGIFPLFIETYSQLYKIIDNLGNIKM